MESSSASLKENLDEEKDSVRPLVAPRLNIPSIICSACDIQGNVTFGKGNLISEK